MPMDIENIFWNNLGWEGKFVILETTHTTAYSKKKRLGKSLKVLLLVHDGYLQKGQLISSDQTLAERATFKALKKLGYEVEIAGLSLELHPLIEKLSAYKPDLVFPFLEEFHCSAELDFAPMAVLESLSIPFVGSGSKGLIVSRHKKLAKRKVQTIGIRTAEEYNEKPPKFPVIVKSGSEDASLGLHQNCVCFNEKDLSKALKKARRSQMSFPMIEEFISGREIYVSIIAGKVMRVFTPWELRLPNVSTIASSKVKWDSKFRRKHKISSGKMKGLSSKLHQELKRQSLKIFERLNLKGYGRIDFRMNESGHLFFLEANANPNLDPTEDFVRSAKASGLSFDMLIAALVKETLRSRKK